MADKQVGVITEQGYFGTGFGFQEATEEEKEKLAKEDSNKESK